MSRGYLAGGLACAGVLAAAAWLSADPPAAGLEPKGPEVVAVNDPADAIMGDYAGTLTPPAGEPIRPEVKVFPEKDGTYHVVVYTTTAKGGKVLADLKGKLADGKVALTGQDGWAGTLADGELKAESPAGGELAARRVVKVSPTAGEKPPAGAVVLLPFEPGKPSSLAEWKNANWKLMSDGSVLVFKGGNTSKRQFGAVKLHVEFMTPYMADKGGQGRGNSGVYLQGAYEVQVLDSFGQPARDNEAGGLYHVATPKVNAALPPLTWQTYDITFRPARFGADGKRTAPAEISVVYNGVLIHDKVKLEKGTGGGGGGNVAAGPLMLQDHGNPVRYRNIWLVELKEETRMSETHPQEWTSLFNGKDLAGWTCKPGSWAVEPDGVLARKGGGYVWTEKQYGDFVLDLEFKIDAGSNSGVFIRTGETDNPVQTGIEIQVYDTVGKPPARNSCGAVYDLVAPSKNVEKPVGQWNHITITCKGPKIAVAMNGEPIVDMDLDRWDTPRKNPDGSDNKFKRALKDFPRSGHIGLQDHNSPVWYRNIRIRTLD